MIMKTHLDIPRLTASALNPLIAASETVQDTLYNVADVLVMLGEGSASYGSTEATEGSHVTLETCRQALMYEAHQVDRKAVRPAAPVADDWVSWAAALPIRHPRAKLLLLLLAASADSDGNANAAPGLLSERAGMPSSKVVEALTWLEMQGHIRIANEPTYSAILHRAES